MEFERLVRKSAKQLSTFPRKLPSSQISSQLRKCNSMASLNNLLRFCSYGEDYGPTEAMSLVMLHRLVLLIWRLPGKTAKDWHQMQVHLSFIKGSILKKKQVPALWKLLIVHQVITAHHQHDQPLLEEPELFLHESIQEAYSENRGRHVKAISRIKAGEIVLVDPKPLAMIAFHPGQGFDTLCIHCAEASVVCPFPCPTCPDVDFW